jgi:hypothetical protein
LSRAERGWGRSVEAHRDPKPGDVRAAAGAEELELAALGVDHVAPPDEVDEDRRDKDTSGPRPVPDLGATRLNNPPTPGR